VEQKTNEQSNEQQLLAALHCQLCSRGVCSATRPSTSRPQDHDSSSHPREISTSVLQLGLLGEDLQGRGADKAALAVATTVPLSMRQKPRLA